MLGVEILASLTSCNRVVLFGAGMVMGGLGILLRGMGGLMTPLVVMILTPLCFFWVITFACCVFRLLGLE